MTVKNLWKACACVCSESEAEHDDSDFDEEEFFRSDQVLVAGNLMQSKKSMFLHHGSADAAIQMEPVTLRGLYGSGYCLLPAGAAFAWPKCTKCFSRRSGLTEFLAMLE